MLKMSECFSALTLYYRINGLNVLLRSIIFKLVCALVGQIEIEVK